MLGSYLVESKVLSSGVAGDPIFVCSDFDSAELIAQLEQIRVLAEAAINPVK